MYKILCTEPERMPTTYQSRKCQEGKIRVLEMDYRLHPLAVLQLFLENKQKQFADMLVNVHHL